MNRVEFIEYRTMKVDFVQRSINILFIEGKFKERLKNNLRKKSLQDIYLINKETMKIDPSILSYDTQLTWINQH